MVNKKLNWNKYYLYSQSDKVELSKQATKEISTLVNELGKKLYDISVKYREVGAQDTASMDMIIRDLSCQARGWIK